MWFLSLGNVTIRTCKVSSSSSGPASFISEMLASGVPCLELYSFCLPFFPSILLFLFLPFLLNFLYFPSFPSLSVAVISLLHLGTIGNSGKERTMILASKRLQHEQGNRTNTKRTPLELVLHFSTYHLLATAPEPCVERILSSELGSEGMNALIN